MAMGGLAGAALGIVIAGIVAIVGVGILLQTNSTAIGTAGHGSLAANQYARSGAILLDLVPLIIAAVVVIGGLVYGLYKFNE